MSKSKPDPAATPAVVVPADQPLIQGGSYVVDPQTGDRTRVEHPPTVAARAAAQPTPEN